MLDDGSLKLVSDIEGIKGPVKRAVLLLEHIHHAVRVDTLDWEFQFLNLFILILKIQPSRSFCKLIIISNRIYGLSSQQKHSLVIVIQLFARCLDN